MFIRKTNVAEKIVDYLHHKIDLSELVDWAEWALMEGQFEEAYFEQIRDAVARLGLADVQAFGLSWEDCEKILEQLGYRASIEVTEIE
jgi:arsenate reductase-like glutaredoxin family protein